MTKHSLAALAGAALTLPQIASAAQFSGAPPVVGDVTVSASDLLMEETPDGAYGEPEWVQQRRFSLTRIYVQQDPGHVGVETWFRTRHYDDGIVTLRSKNEIEIGLPGRFQLDLYENLVDEDDGEGWRQEEVAIELRYAFADWNKLPGNPTLYFEYVFAADGADVIEPKLLLGGEFCEGWHWGLNFILERPVWGDDINNEYAIAAGISKTLIDSKFSIGLEAKVTKADSEHAEAIFGPSVQWRPTDNTHLDLVALAGLTDESPNAECWLIFGFDFGAGEKDHSGYKPRSSSDGR
jgi:hypothetical protein